MLCDSNNAEARSSSLNFDNYRVQSSILQFVLVLKPGYMAYTTRLITTYLFDVL